MNSLTPFVDKITCDNIITAWEDQMDLIQARISEDARLTDYDESIEGCLKRNKKTLGVAIEHLKDLPAYIEVYNEEHGIIIMTESLKDDNDKLTKLLDYAEKHRSNVDSISEENDEESSNVCIADSAEELAKLRRVQMESKNDLECVLEQIYPDMKEAIKEILSRLEEASKKAVNEEDSYLELKEPYLLEAVECLVQAGVVTECGLNRLKLSCLDKTA